MANFSVLLEAKALDEQILGVIAEVMAESDIVVLDTYKGLDRDTGALAEQSETPRRARILAEWIRRKGRFALDLDLWGPGVRTDVSRAELARIFARRLGAPILMSDCSHFGFSWLKYDVDGAIWEVVSNTADINDFDLLCDLDPAHADYCPARLIWPADKALAPQAQTPAPSQWRACEGELPGSTRLCIQFGIPRCPKIA